eukprot:gnl/TRDRNA2_/TRDRNA2_162948_c1_seq1.p1 gnl/TRDRNA2_/TRDRNA2_162948_c1~~gnl/TRDRNA2_/TRDRNA2_162948_c1_seq1.p1  ORF type:complete len:122 (-),score=18.74 gnl/TRDRNA2_/TRDRNA2_162948_c1_seq1:47-412(-)
MVHITVMLAAGKVLLDVDQPHGINGRELRKLLRETGLVDGLLLRLLVDTKEICDADVVPGEEDASVVVMCVLLPTYSVITWGRDDCGGDSSPVADRLASKVVSSPWLATSVLSRRLHSLAR